MTNFKPEAKLEVFNIGKRYKKRPVLRNVSLYVRRGEAVGLLGPNGAGKTTCFYCVTGLITPDYGDVHIDGQDITNMPMYRRARMGIGYLPQEASIFRTLSVEDNIKAILELVVDDESKRENMLEELLNEFSIAHLRKSPALALSGGERRRRGRSAAPAGILPANGGGVPQRTPGRSGGNRPCRSGTAGVRAHQRCDSAASGGGAYDGAADSGAGSVSRGIAEAGQERRHGGALFRPAQGADHAV